MSKLLRTFRADLPELAQVYLQYNSRSQLQPVEASLSGPDSFRHWALGGVLGFRSDGGSLPESPSSTSSTLTCLILEGSPSSSTVRIVEVPFFHEEPLSSRRLISVVCLLPWGSWGPCVHSRRR